MVEGVWRLYRSLSVVVLVSTWFNVILLYSPRIHTSTFSLSHSLSPIHSLSFFSLVSKEESLLYYIITGISRVKSYDIKVIGILLILYVLSGDNAIPFFLRAFWPVAVHKYD